MGILFALLVAYVGGPIGLVMMLIGGIGLLRRTDKTTYGWPGFLLSVGVLLAGLGGFMWVELANTNFGL